MTTLWERLKFAVATDVDAIVTKKEEKNPLAMLNRYITEAENQTTTTGKWVERQAQLNGKLEKELAEASAMLHKRHCQLELAQASGEADLADFAAREVQIYTTRAKTLQNNLDENIAEFTELEQRYEEMKHKVKDMKVKQLQLMGKENATRAHFQMDKLLSPELVAERIGSFEDMTSYITTLGTKVEEQHERSAMERRLEFLEKKSENQKELV